MEIEEPVPDLTDIFIQVRLITKSSRFAVPDVPYSLPGLTKTGDLNQLINELLKESFTADGWNSVEFDFLINGEILQESVGEYVYQRKISSENVVDIEYIEHLPAPEPEASLEHPDWVSAVQMLDDFILTGCYDNCLRVWTRKGDLLLAHQAHLAPIKAVSWVSISENESSFLTASHDQTVALWTMENRKKNSSISPRAFFRGHAGSVDGLAVSPNGQQFCSVSWDKMVKIWSLSDQPVPEPDEIVEPADKKFKGDGKKLTRTPVVTLAGHKEAATCCAWTAPGEIITASWDHTIKLWDVELGGMSRQLDGTKAFLDISYSPLNRLLVSGATDRIVRLYDPRSNEGSIVKIGFASHMGWVSSVSWSPKNENLFVSASYDKLMKMWDVRSPKSPVYDMAGHSDKILCATWSNSNLLLSGGADSDLKMFSAEA